VPSFLQFVLLCFDCSCNQCLPEFRKKHVLPLRTCAFVCQCNQYNFHTCVFFLPCRSVRWQLFKHKGKAAAAFQAECPFGKCKHWSPMYALTTGCKRQRSFKDDVGEERVIRELKHWLRRADEAADREEYNKMAIDVDLEDDSLIVSPPKFNFPDRSVEDVIAQKSRRFSRKRQLPG